VFQVRGSGGRAGPSRHKSPCSQAFLGRYWHYRMAMCPLCYGWIWLQNQVYGLLSDG
jgi:hypothetical protein